jgi:acyl-CoA reductase-like NAD-dependent aldehyde dehydrogenase
MTAVDSSTTFESLNPRTGDVVGHHPVNTAEEVQAAVDRAHEEAAWWSALSYDEREKHLQTWKGAMTRRVAQLAEVMHQETGKPHGDAMLEAALAIDHLSWAASHAEKVLKRRKVSSGLVMANQAAYLEYQPLGVIGVIGPWNYPVFTPMGSIAYALAAGNTVVFKPSELTPGVGHALATMLAEAVPEHTLIEVVTGLGETGAALCRTPGVGKIAFTGSTATGKRVMAACAETLTPVLIECGGKDALIVAADADLEAAADATVWGGMSNAGQTCVGVERVYAVESVAEEFTAKVVEKARAVRTGTEIGPMTMSSQTEVVRRHVADALARGGRAVVGGAESVKPPFVEPVVIVDVPEDSSAVTEETFGPLIVVNRVPDVDEAVRRANGTGYGLGATVFSAKDGDAIAARLRCGMVAVNGVISFAGIPALPFGGVGDSGFGRIHGEDGLREFTRPQAVARQRFPLPIAVTSFRRTSGGMKALLGLVKVLRGR